MDKNDLTLKQLEWMGTKPKGNIRFGLMIATIAAILSIILYAVIENYLGFQSPLGGIFIGIFSGVLTSGIIVGISWATYDYFLPIYLHKNFRPKISGSWFAYYPDSTLGTIEFIYIKQIANKVSGTITSHRGKIYEFTGKLTLNTLVLEWVRQEENYNVAGAIVLKPRSDEIWEGVQVYSHPSGYPQVGGYILTKNKDRIPADVWMLWLAEFQGQLSTFI